MMSKVKCSFKIGEHVLAQNFRGMPKWLHGVIVGKTGNVSYQVKIEHQVWSRHVDQLLQSEANSEILRSTSPTDCTTFPVEDSIRPQKVSDSHNANQDVNPSTSAGTTVTPEEPRYPQRQRRAPNRFTPNV